MASEATITIHRVIILLEEDGASAMCDAVPYKGGLWLAPAWSEKQKNGLQCPNRLIRVDKLRCQKMPENNSYGADFAVNAPLPKGLFASDIPKELKERFDVLERPNVGVLLAVIH